MVRLNLPEYPVKTRTQGKQHQIFDLVRKKYVRLTPEEWVRQHFINYLVNDLSYPKSLVRIESGLTYNQLEKRSDIIVFDKNIKPFLLVECKATNVKLSNQTFDQLSLYNQSINARYLVITNGLKHYCCSIDYNSNSYKFQDRVPAFELNN